MKTVTVTLPYEEAEALADHPAKLQPDDPKLYWVMKVKRACAKVREAMHPKPWQPLREIESEKIIEAHLRHGLTADITIWVNDEYEVYAHEYLAKQVHLSIKRYDRSPHMPWRHLQQIKLEICGLESEAVELFPAESRLVDNANQRHLWVSLEPMEAGEVGEIETPDGPVLDLLVIPRTDPYLGVGWPDGLVTSDEAVEQYNDSPHPGQQEPWQEGLTTGRNEKTNVVHTVDVTVQDD